MNTISHSGVKGMKWGVRKAVSSVKGSTSKKLGPAKSEDSERARALLKKKLSELSNHELSQLNTRQSLERTYKLNNPNVAKKASTGLKATASLLGTVTALTAAAKSPTAKAGYKLLAKYIKNGNKL